MRMVESEEGYNAVNYPNWPQKKKRSGSVTANLCASADALAAALAMNRRKDFNNHFQ
jgi:hypothetical protein